MSNFTYCVDCGQAMMEYTANQKQLYFCPQCGMVLQHLGEGRYRCLGTFDGNRHQREVTDLLRQQEKEVNANDIRRKDESSEVSERVE